MKRRKKATRMGDYIAYGMFTGVDHHPAAVWDGQCTNA